MGNRIFDFVNHGLLLLIGIVTVIPFIYILAVSFTSPHEVAKGGFILFPKEFSLAAYRYIFSTDTLIRSLGVSVYITVIGTFINLLFTSLMAYPLSRRYLRGRQPILLGVLFTMLFSGGMIPTYFVVKSLHLTDTLWSLMLPTAISAFNLIVLKNFFQAIPDELEDAAKIDGCNDVGVLFRIVLPLSMPAMATFSLFTRWPTGTVSSALLSISTIVRSGLSKSGFVRLSFWHRAGSETRVSKRPRSSRLPFAWRLSYSPRSRLCWCTHSCKSTLPKE